MRWFILKSNSILTLLSVVRLHFRAGIFVFMGALLLLPAPIATASGSLDFSDLKDGLTLDENTDVDLNNLSFSTSGDGLLQFNQTGGTQFGSDVQVGTRDLVMKKKSELTAPNYINSARPKYSPDGSLLSITLVRQVTTEPCVLFYQVSGDSYTLVNPLRYTEIDPTPYELTDCRSVAIAFSADGAYLAIQAQANNASSDTIYLFKRHDNMYVYLSTKGLTGKWITDMAFSSDASYLAVAHNASPNMTIYKRSGDIFTQLPNPSSLPTGTGTGTDFSSGGRYLAVTQSTSPYINLYRRDGDTFTKLNTPATLPTGVARDVLFTAYNERLIVAHDNYPYMTVYDQDGDVFTKLPNPADLPPDDATALSVSGDGEYVAVTNKTTAPYITLYKWVDNELAKLNPLDPSPTISTYAVSLSPDGDKLAVFSASSSVIARLYKNEGSADVDVSGLLTVGRGLQVTGTSTSLDTALSVSGDAVLSRNVTIGDANYPGSLDIKGGLTIAGLTALNGDAVFNGMATFNDDTSFLADVEFGGTTTFDDIDVGGSITVSSKNAGKQLISRGASEVYINLTSSFATEPAVTGSLVEVPLTQQLYNQYVTAGTCAPNDFEYCEYQIRNYIADMKYTIIRYSSSAFELILQEPSPYNIEFSWIAVEVGE